MLAECLKLLKILSHITTDDLLETELLTINYFMVNSWL